MKKRFVCVLLALLLVLSLSTTAFAAAVSEAGVNLTAKVQSGQATVQVFLTAEHATNGKIEVTYDKESVSLVSVNAEDETWMTSINTGSESEVSFAWINSNLPAEETCVMTLVFDIVDSSMLYTSIFAEVTELYAGSNAMGISDANNYILVNIGGSGTGVPDTPVVTPPAPEIPLEPDAPDEPDTPVVPDTPDEPAEPECPFVDIDDSWAKEYIITAYYAGLVNGTSETTYEPESNLTRGSFVTLLYRLNGKPAAEGEIPFTDVADAWYTDAVIWGYNNGIVNGKSADIFDPDGNITRQELATMLMRYAKHTGMDVSASADLESFDDDELVADWAEGAMKWAVAEGIINGRSGNTLAPTELCDRAEAATILVRFAGL